MPSLEEKLKKNHFTPSELRFSIGRTGVVDWILEVNLKERRGVKFEDVKQHFMSKSDGKLVYSDQFIEDTLEKLSQTEPHQDLCCKNGRWYAVTLHT